MRAAPLRLNSTCGGSSTSFLTKRGKERIGRSALAVLAVALVLCGWCLSGPALAEIICADDLLPEGMAVTATGTSPSCAGSCRAREMKPVCGAVMKICASEPIPKGYVLDSITTTPGCQCVGAEDNAYVIRYVGIQDEPGLSFETDPSASDRYQHGDGSFGDFSSQGPTGFLERERYPYGDPPFGNVLCATKSMQAQPYGNPPLASPPQARGLQLPDSGFQLPDNGASSPWSVSPPSWNSNDQQSEPFRVGQ